MIPGFKSRRVDAHMRPAHFQRNPRTDADVELLLGRFRDLLPDGRVIAHAEIEALLKMSRKQSRYRTVTDRWRRLLMDEQRIFLDGRSAKGAGFASLTPDEMVRFANKQVRAVGRIIKKAIAVNSLPDPSEIKNSETRNYQARLLLACEQIARTQKHVLLDLTRALQPSRQLPRAASV